jgi:hypothetical protein
MEKANIWFMAYAFTFFLIFAFEEPISTNLFCTFDTNRQKIPIIFARGIPVLSKCRCWEKLGRRSRRQGQKIGKEQWHHCSE